MAFKCGLENNKPKICRDWPGTQRQLLSFPNCTYYFVNKIGDILTQIDLNIGNGIRKGECNQCGECCIETSVYLSNIGRKLENERCPYLEATDGD